MDVSRMAVLVVRCFALILLAVGVGLSTERLMFLNNSVAVQGTVVPGELYRGPPRSPRNIPLEVSYQPSDKRDPLRVTIPSPMFRKFANGDAIPLLVSNSDPQDARTPWIAELWYYPLAFICAGLGILVLFSAASRVRRPTVEI